MTRKFKASVSRDNGKTWKKVRASGWPIDINGDVGPTREPDAEDGYVIAIDVDEEMIDVVVTERDLKLMKKDIEKRRKLDAQEDKPVLLAQE
jgi:hypothetical protein